MHLFVLYVLFEIKFNKLIQYWLALTVGLMICDFQKTEILKKIVW